MASRKTALKSDSLGPELWLWVKSPAPSEPQPVTHPYGVKQDFTSQVEEMHGLGTRGCPEVWAPSDSPLRLPSWHCGHHLAKY